MNEAANTERMFFAIWPDQAVSELLETAGKKLHETCRGRITRRETIHITLAFLGEVEVSRLNELLSMAGEVNATSFSLDLTKFGCWRHNRIAWVAPEVTPPALTDLASDLSEKLKAVGFKLDSRPYVPHITLFRKAECREALPVIDAIQWNVSEFVLVKSVLSNAGSAYEVVGRWPLKAVATDSAQ